MQLECGYIRVRFRVERVDVLCNDTGEQAEVAKRSHSVVGRIGLAAVQVGPAQEAARPVSLPGLVVGAKLVVVDGTVGLVQGVGAVTPAVVSQTAGDTDASTREENSATVSIAAGIVGGEEGV